MIRLHGERDGYVGLHPGVIKGEWGRGKGVGVFGTWYSLAEREILFADVESGFSFPLSWIRMGQT